MQLECPEGNGACQSFALFLAEKAYFRPFTWADIKEMQASGKRLQCVNCGAGLPPDFSLSAAGSYVRLVSHTERQLRVSVSLYNQKLDLRCNMVNADVDACATAAVFSHSAERHYAGRVIGRS